MTPRARGQAQADVGVARATLARRRLDVGFATITSPISGRIGASGITEGALVAQGDANALATVHQTSQVYVDVSQPAARFEALRLMGGQGSTTVELLDSNNQPLGVSGRLLFSEMVVDPGTGNMKARILVDNASQRLIPGMFVRARLPRGPEQILPQVPQQAVVFFAGKPQVMVVAQNGSVQTRDVQVGDVVNGKYVVTSGLHAGETVIVEGRDRILSPHMIVRAAPLRAAPAAS